ncbi:MAG: 50S ribosomal protein L24 [bacterium]|nr:50S ribosomal protein L24 [bacterium]
MKIRKGDTILIMSGKDRGKRGKVAKVFPEINKIIAENINLAKKHVRPKKQGQKGQVVAIAKPFDASKVKLVCPKCGQAARIGFKITESGKFRICKKCTHEI